MLGDRMKISVVTVSLNAGELLTKTIKSVMEQSYKNIEYIIVDGDSQDGTKGILDESKEVIDILICEKDEGIYYAMNKAVNLLSGEYVIFMNAGDYFFDFEVITNVVSHLEKNDVDFIYGDTYWCNASGNEELIVARPLHSMWKKISFSHQALFTRVSLMKRFKFDTRYIIASDYEFYYSRFVNGASFYHYQGAISKVLAGGVSDENFLLRTYERWRIVTRYSSNLYTHYYYIVLISNFYLKKILRFVGM